MFPIVCANRSQIDSPFPSSFHPPSIWYAAVAVPQKKSFGNWKGSGGTPGVIPSCASGMPDGFRMNQDVRGIGTAAIPSVIHKKVRRFTSPEAMVVSPRPDIVQRRVVPGYISTILGYKVWSRCSQARLYVVRCPVEERL